MTDRQILTLFSFIEIKIKEIPFFSLVFFGFRGVPCLKIKLHNPRSAKPTYTSACGASPPYAQGTARLPDPVPKLNLSGLSRNGLSWKPELLPAQPKPHHEPTRLRVEAKLDQSPETKLLPARVPALALPTLPDSGVLGTGRWKGEQTDR